MVLSSEQKLAIEKGEAIPVTLDGLECVVVRQDQYERLKEVAAYDDKDVSPREFYSLVDHIMADDDANDPALNSYQDYEHCGLPLEVYKKAEEFIRIGRRAVHKAQERNRALGIPNVYSINGILYYELPNGELSREDPYTEDKRP